jgi:DNA-directed RNA polymerase subunit RPC12/RpoP
MSRDGMLLIRCRRCGQPVARLAPGSRVEIACRHCGVREYHARQAFDLLGKLRDTTASSVEGHSS